MEGVLREVSDVQWRWTGDGAFGESKQGSGKATGKMGASEKSSEESTEIGSEKTIGKGATLQKTLQKRPLETPLKIAKKLGVQELTPARAMIAELIRRYLVLGIDCSLLEVQKLAWFLERNVIRFGLPLRRSAVAALPGASFRVRSAGALIGISLTPHAPPNSLKCAPAHLLLSGPLLVFHG